MEDYTGAVAGSESGCNERRIILGVHCPVLGTTDARARREILAYSKLKPDMVRLVTMLRKRYRTALLSNQIVGWLGVYIKRHKLRRIFDVIVPSYDAKFAKPHINIYNITLKNWENLPQRVSLLTTLSGTSSLRDASASLPFTFDPQGK